MPNSKAQKMDPLPSFREFLGKVAWNALIGLIVLLIALIIGMLGYRYLEHASWADSYANAAMILSGVGAPSPLQTDAGKIYLGTYALLSGIVFLFVIALLLSPMIHRLLHKFHLERERNKQEKI